MTFSGHITRSPPAIWVGNSKQAGWESVCHGLQTVIPGARTMASDQHFAACEAADQCERNELCTRGFRHHGKGGHCSFKPKAGPTEPPAAVVASDTIGKRRVGQRGVKLLEVGTIADKESTALTGFDMSKLVP